MRFKTLVLLPVVCMLALPARASYADLVVSLSGQSGSSVTVSIHNPNETPESARVTLTVRFTDGTTQTLTSGAFTMPAGASSALTISTSKTVSEITDDPEPIAP